MVIDMPREGKIPKESFRDVEVTLGTPEYQRMGYGIKRSRGFLGLGKQRTKITFHEKRKTGIINGERVTIEPKLHKVGTYFLEDGDSYSYDPVVSQPLSAYHEIIDTFDNEVEKVAEEAKIRGSAAIRKRKRELTGSGPEKPSEYSDVEFGEIRIPLNYAKVETFLKDVGSREGYSVSKDMSIISKSGRRIGWIIRDEGIPHFRINPAYAHTNETDEFREMQHVVNVAKKYRTYLGLSRTLINTRAFRKSRAENSSS
jgi:hypothetical protein